MCGSILRHDPDAPAALLVIRAPFPDDARGYAGLYREGGGGMFRTIGGHRFNVVSFGPGPRTFLGVGGWAGSWELWQQPFEAMSRTWRTVSYDHRGTGGTVVPVEEITIEAMTRDVFAVMDALGIERCVLGTESAGARTALQAALDHPDRFEGLVLVDGNWSVSQTTPDNPFSTGLRTDFEATIRDFMERCTPGADYAHIRRWGRDILSRSGPEAAARLNEFAAGWDVASRVDAVHVPTLIVHSAGDRLVPVAQSQELAARIPGSKLVLIESESHVPTMTHADMVVAAIEEFFGHT